MPEHCVQATCYEQVRLRDLPALFTSLRVGSVPDGMYRYEIRMDEDSSEPYQIARHILVNHYGTLLTTDPIQLPADGYLNFSGEELVFSGAPLSRPTNFRNATLPAARMFWSCIPCGRKSEICFSLHWTPRTRPWGVSVMCGEILTGAPGFCIRPGGPMSGTIRSIHPNLPPIWKRPSTGCEPDSRR